MMRLSKTRNYPEGNLHTKTIRTMLGIFQNYSHWLTMFQNYSH
jgi:hypothetical protein